MAITAAQILAPVRVTLQDPDSTRWDDQELLGYLNEGRRQMAELRPSVFGVGSTFNHTTAAGNRQRLTNASALRLVSVDANVASGRALRSTQPQQLDAFRPGWRSDEAEDDAKNWWSDPSDPLAFWIYPAVGAGKSLQVHADLCPAEIPLDKLDDAAFPAVPYDIYDAPLRNYVLFRAYGKDAEYGGNAALAAAYYQLFTSAFGPSA